MHSCLLYSSSEEQLLLRGENSILDRSCVSILDKMPTFLSIRSIENTGVKSSESTPSSTKQRRSTFLSLSLLSVESSSLKEPSQEAKELERKIYDFDITPGSAYWLGKKLLAFKEKNVEERVFAQRLIELLHNRVAAPLKGYFKKENNDFDKHAYNTFLEKSLPRIGDGPQETPLIKMGSKSACSSVTSSAVNGLSFDSRDVQRRSVFEDCESN